MTKESGGNEAAALVNAVLGNVLGVFISPLLIINYLDLTSKSSGSLSYSSIFIKLTLTVVVPLIFGQTLRFFSEEHVKFLQLKVNFSCINSSLLLIIIWSVFSDTFYQNIFGTVSGFQTFLVALICTGLFITFSTTCYGFGELLAFNLPDRIAGVMCGATKTVAMGVPLINVIFHGDPSIGILTIPLLMYHALQLIFGSFFVIIFRRWTVERSN